MVKRSRVDAFTGKPYPLITLVLQTLNPKPVCFAFNVVLFHSARLY